MDIQISSNIERLLFDLYHREGVYIATNSFESSFKGKADPGAGASGREGDLSPGLTDQTIRSNSTFKHMLGKQPGGVIETFLIRHVFDLGAVERAR